LVVDGKSDRESDADPICIQIGERIGCKNVRVDGPLAIDNIFVRDIFPSFLEVIDVSMCPQPEEADVQ
jgi:hypothetical protein